MRRFVIFSITFSIFFQTVSGNTSDDIESLLQQAKTDTAKVMVYNRFARELMNGQNRNYLEARQYAEQGLSLAELVHFDQGRAELYRTMGNASYFLNEYENAVSSYQQAANISEKLNDFIGLAQNYYNISLVYSVQTKIYYALDYILRALRLWEQLENTTEVFRAYRMIAQLYQNVEEYTLAADYTILALQLAQKKGNRSEEARLYELLARINYFMGNHPVVEDYYKQSLEIFEEIDDQLQIARISHNMATNLYFKNNPKTAMTLLRKSAVIYEKLSPANGSLFLVYNSIANLLMRENQNDSAVFYKEKGLAKAVLSGNSQTMSSAYCIIGDFYMKKGNISRAERDFLKAYDISQKSGLVNMQSDALSGLSDVYLKKEDYRTAVMYLQKYQALKDSLNNEINRKNIQQLTMQHDFEKAETEKGEAMRQQLSKQQQDIKQQRIFVLVASISLVFVVFSLIFIIRSYRRNQRINVKLEHQHVEILRINDELKESHEELSVYRDHLEEMVKEQTAKLRQSEIQLRTLSDNLPGGCIYRKHVFHDGKEFISYISSTAEHCLGMNAETIMGNADLYYRRINPEDLQVKRMYEQESMHTMSSYTCEYRLMKDDKEVWLLENAMPHADKNQSIVWDGIIIDITDRKIFEKELVEAKEHAEESDMLKSAFLANMSHELRTPMNGIVGFLNFIEREDLAAEKRQAYAGIIRNNIQQLLQLIGDIIDISKLDSHQLSLHSAEFDLNSLLLELEIFFSEFILKWDKKLELILDRSGFISPCIIKSDPLRVRQVLSNLIGNAVKFTEKGFIRFGYKLTGHDSQLYFFVEDTGIGIPEPQLEYVFERFRQVHDEQIQARYGGTGLGLAISKNLVEMMGGQIGANSDVGFGSSFYFTLPYCHYI